MSEAHSLYDLVGMVDDREAEKLRAVASAFRQECDLAFDREHRMER